MLRYRRFAGLAAARAITRLYGASRLFVNFFQPSFRLAAKHRVGAKVTKHYHLPQTPCEQLLQEHSVPTSAKEQLREIAAKLDPLKLLEEMRAVQAYLAALADGEAPPVMSPEPPNLAAFVASLSSAWHAGEIRATFSIEAKPRYLRGLQKLSLQTQCTTSSRQLTPCPLPLRLLRLASAGRSRNWCMQSRRRPESTRCAWYGLSSAADSKELPISRPCSPLKSCVSGSQVGLLAGNTSSHVASISDVGTPADAVWSLALKHTGCSATNHAADGPISLEITGMRWCKA